jgi:FdhD protein
MKTDIKVNEFKSGRLVKKDDLAAVEKNMEILLNRNTRISVSISPGDLRAFVYGFLFTSGFIRAEEDVEYIQIEAERMDVRLKARKDFDSILSLGSSGGRYLEYKTARAPFKEKLVPDFNTLIPLFEEFTKMPVVFPFTGGTHSAALSNGRAVLFFTEDIGRHNAVDKAIGKAFLEKIDFNSLYLMLSGRMSGEIVKKSYFSGIRTIVSRAAPTSLAIERAKEENMTLIGFLRGDKFNIYS